MVPGQLSAALDSPPEASTGEDTHTSPATHRRRRKKTVPMPAEQVARQGGISSLAFQVLGKDAAIAFLNAEHAGLGGRPLALATQGPAGDALVRVELERLVPPAAPNASREE